jgi:hypothetical protein
MNFGKNRFNEKNISATGLQFGPILHLNFSKIIKIIIHLQYPLRPIHDNRGFIRINCSFQLLNLSFTIDNKFTKYLYILNRDTRAIYLHLLSLVNEWRLSSLNDILDTFLIDIQQLLVILIHMGTYLAYNRVKPHLNVVLKNFTPHNLLQNLLDSVQVILMVLIDQKILFIELRKVELREEVDLKQEVADNEKYLRVENLWEFLLKLNLNYLADHSDPDWHVVKVTEYVVQDYIDEELELVYVLVYLLFDVFILEETFIYLLFLDLGT